MIERINSGLRAALTPRNSSRHYLAEWAGEAAAVGSDKDFKVLDAGAGDAQYRSLFSHVTYETADFTAVNKEYGQIDHVCDLADLPMPDSTYDMVFSSQTLEHLPNPITVLREFHRVLKPGGQAWLSAPFFYAEHEQPYDFYRYTQFAWKHMAEQTAFEVVDIQWLEGYYGTLSYQLGMAAGAMLKKRKPFLGMLFWLLARRFARADIRSKVTTVGMPKNYRVILGKRAEVLH